MVCLRLAARGRRGEGGEGCWPPGASLISWEEKEGRKGLALTVAASDAVSGPRARLSELVGVLVEPELRLELERAAAAQPEPAPPRGRRWPLPHALVCLECLPRLLERR